jgi:hypothetical protein
MFFYWQQNRPFLFTEPAQMACTEEAKICPDGSAVGRQGPDCEFAECPTPAVSAEPVTQVVDEMADWKTYRNEKYGFEVRYPSELEKKDRYLMSNLGELGYFWAKNVSDDFSLSIWDTSTYSYDQLQQVPPGGIDPNSIKKYEIILDGVPAIKYTYIAVGDSRSGSGEVTEVSLLRNKLVYIFKCKGLDCEKIITSIKFTEETITAKVGQEFILNPSASFPAPYDVSDSVDSYTAYHIVWGDGTPDLVDACVKTPMFGHTYQNSGTFTLKYTLSKRKVCSDPASSFGPVVEKSFTIVVE